MNPLHRRAFEETLERLAPGRFRHRVIDGHDVWADAATAGLRPWLLPWREVRQNPDAYEDPRLFKMGSRRTVVRTAQCGIPVFVKRSLERTLAERAANFFRPPKDVQEFLLALQWRTSGIHVPEPTFLAFGRDTQFDCPVRYLATQPLPAAAEEGRDHFRRNGLLSPNFEAVAAFASRLHDGGNCHADFRSDHIFFEAAAPDAANAATIWLIDLDGSTHGRAPSRRRRARALLQFLESVATYGLDADHVARFLRVYDPAGSWGFDSAALAGEALRRRASAKRNRGKTPPPGHQSG